MKNWMMAGLAGAVAGGVGTLLGEVNVGPERRAKLGRQIKRWAKFIGIALLALVLVVALPHYFLMTILAVVVGMVLFRTLEERRK